MDLLYASTSHLVALRDWLEDQLPAEVGVFAAVLPDPSPVAPFVFLEAGRPEASVGIGGPMMGGDQWTALAAIARSVGTTADQAGRVADLVRWAVMGRVSSGAYAVALPDLGGSPVTRRSTGNDALPDFAGPVPQVSETLLFELGRSPDDQL